MKTTGKYICIALALASVLSSVACTADYLDESDYPMAPGTGDVPVLDFDGQDAVSVSKDGGEYEFSFVANLPWMVESRASWITVTSETRGSGGTDPVKVTFSVTRNASHLFRNSVIHGMLKRTGPETVHHGRALRHFPTLLLRLSIMTRYTWLPEFIIRQI